MFNVQYSKFACEFDAGEARAVLGTLRMGVTDVLGNHRKGARLPSCVRASRRRPLHPDCPGWAGVLRCDLELAGKIEGGGNERSGSGGIGEFGGGSGGGRAEDGCRIFVGLLVSGD